MSLATCFRCNFLVSFFLQKVYFAVLGAFALCCATVSAVYAQSVLVQDCPIDYKRAKFNEIRSSESVRLSLDSSLVRRARYSFEAGVISNKKEDLLVGVISDLVLVPNHSGSPHYEYRKVKPLPSKAPTGASVTKNEICATDSCLLNNDGTLLNEQPLFGVLLPTQEIEPGKDLVLHESKILKVNKGKDIYALDAEIELRYHIQDYFYIKGFRLARIEVSAKLLSAKSKLPLPEGLQLAAESFGVIFYNLDERIINKSEVYRCMKVADPSFSVGSGAFVKTGLVASEFYTNDAEMEEAARRGVPSARLDFAVSQLSDPNATGKGAALASIEELAASGYATAIDTLATMLLEGKGVEKNEERAIEMYERAVTSGYPRSKVNLGLTLLESEKFRNIERGKSLLESAGLDGEAAGYEKLGLYYKQIDAAKARTYLEKSTNAGSPYAAANLGMMLLQSQGGQFDPLRGLVYLKFASRSGISAVSAPLSDWERQINPLLSKQELAAIEDASSHFDPQKLSESLYGTADSNLACLEQVRGSYSYHNDGREVYRLSFTGQSVEFTNNPDTASGRILECYKGFVVFATAKELLSRTQGIARVSSDSKSLIWKGLEFKKV